MSPSMGLKILVCGVLYLLHYPRVLTQTCSLRAESFESEFCKLKQEVDILTKDDAKVVNNEVEISKLWHKLQEETKQIENNRKAITELEKNVTINSVGGRSSKDLEEIVHNVTRDFESRFSQITDMVMNLSQKMDDLALKCRGCSPDIHPCTYKPCKNGGKCVEIAKDYACVCATGFSGKNCDMADHCKLNPCKNNGTCISNVISHTCVCPLPFTGRNCTIEILPCDTNPCTRGKCIPNGKSYKCVCDPGFFGEMCNSRVDPALLTTLKTTAMASKATTLPVSPIQTSTTTSAAKSVNFTSTTTTILPSASNAHTPNTTSGMTNNTSSINSSTPASPFAVAGPDPCADPAVCNAPSKCVPKGRSYECKCPETKATLSDPCITPYYFEMFSICCTIDTCQPGGQPNCS